MSVDEASADGVKSDRAFVIDRFVDVSSREVTAGFRRFARTPRKRRWKKKTVSERLVVVDGGGGGGGGGDGDAAGSRG